MTNEDKQARNKVYQERYRQKNHDKKLASQKAYRDKTKDKAKEYYENNKEVIIEKQKLYHEINREIRLQKQKEYQENNKEKIAAQRKEYQKNNKEKIAAKEKKYQKENKEKIAIRKKIYREANKDKIAIYRSKNKTKILEQVKKYNRERKITDNLFRMKCKMRSLLGNTFMRFGYKKNSRSEEILGCTFEEFITYLESKFEPWMTWENRGLFNGSENFGWDIDHKIPLVTATCEEDMIKLNHYTNLQPLCSYTNRILKRAKV